jgi:tetratricopeptide (TPR) repeat protein
MGYVPYYVFLLVAGWALRYPYLLLLAVAVWLLRRWIPDPVLYFKHAGHVRRLKAEIKDNADNVTARRDLAKVWLAKKRPRRAIELLEAARRRDRDSEELPFLLGKALLMAGRAEEALPVLVEAAQKNERFMYGEAYLVAGKALYKLRRFPEADDALTRYLVINSSSVEGRVMLACTRRELKDGDGARRATREALETFAQVPGFRRRAEWRWYLRARLMTLGLA